MKHMIVVFNNVREKCLVSMLTQFRQGGLEGDVAYRGFLAPGAKMGIGAPRCVRLASVEGALLRYRGSGAEPQPPALLRTFGCKWNPFLNYVNTIFNSACQSFSFFFFFFPFFAAPSECRPGQISPSAPSVRHCWEMGRRPFSWAKIILRRVVAQ